MRIRLNQILDCKKSNSYIAFVLTLFLFFFEMIFRENNLYDYFLYLRGSDDYVYLFIGVLYSVVSYYCFYVFLKISLSSDWKYKILYFTIFSFAVIFEYSYQNALGRFSDFTDLQIPTTTEQKIAAFFLYFNSLALIPCLIFLTCLYKSKPFSSPLKLKGLITLVFIYGIFFTHIAFVSEIFAERKFPVVAMNALARTTCDYLVWGPLLNGNLAVRQTVKTSNLPENYLPQNNIIMIDDESIIGSHLSINGYERKTTPFLEELEAKGVLHNWGIAAAATTASVSTYDILITGLTPDDFPDKSQKKVRTSPMFFQYAKAMNYKTFFFDGQMRVYWGAGGDDTSYIDNRIDPTDLSSERAIESWDTDNEIAKRVNKIISNSTGNFIFIIKRGNHTPYDGNYPKFAEGYKEEIKREPEIYNSKYPNQSETWKPTYNFNSVFEIPSVENYEKVVNTYDNGLKFNLDTFFKNLVDDYQNIPNNTVIFYTGDHGQTFFKEGRASHGGESVEEATVPLFMIGSPPKTVDTNYKAAHCNLFPTLIELMGYNELPTDRKYCLSLFQAKSSDSAQRFFNPLFGPKIPFD